MNWIFNKLLKPYYRERDTIKAEIREAIQTQRSVAASVSTTPAYASIGEFGSMKIAAAYRCLSILSGTVASIPIKVYSRQPNGVYTQCHTSLSDTLTHNPYGMLNGYDTILNAVVQIHNQGNAYLLPIRTMGIVTEIILLSPHSVSYNKYTRKYHVNDPVNKIAGVYDSWEVVHLKNTSVDGGYLGISTIQYAARVLNIAESADEEILETFTDNTVRGFVSGGGQSIGIGQLQDSQLQTVGDKIGAELSSGKKIISLPQGTDFKQLSINPKDAQILENREFSVYDICRFYGVHPDKVFTTAGGNYKASENSQINFLTDTLKPLIRKIEAEFNRKLLLAPERSKYKIEFDLSDISANSDMATTSTYYKTMLELGVLTPNEIRANLHLDEVKDGDSRFVSANLKPINEVKEQSNI